MMIQIVCKSNGPCLKCEKTEKTVRVKGKDFSAVLCMDHVWDHVPATALPKTKKAKKGGDGVDRGTGRGAA